ncbi:hypothetical protein L0B53_03935 [Vibrio sp. SS-MA-C1-2]|uniref:hypothetical protein n=1 Tax=Vibrio sp. SS-MA-C1-2 TaxID=2908646 RepID=UPI001F3DE7F9|nr:hypothetical protein [Vibrio sp. SS-MA-C1-2]UJF17083.1 hypothetical protein L0B53_03935 [Vibrio sp. SS-MA-C1-2]
MIKSDVHRPISFVAFSGSSHVLLPPTTDYKLASLYLSYLSPIALMPVDGGDINALVDTLNSVSALSVKNSTILLLTDGLSDSVKLLKAFAKEKSDPLVTVYFTDLGKQIGSQLNSDIFNGVKLSGDNSSLKKAILLKGKDNAHLIRIVGKMSLIIFWD